MRPVVLRINTRIKKIVQALSCCSQKLFTSNLRKNYAKIIINLVAKENTIVGLDLGTQKTRVALATLEADGSLPNIAGIGIAPSAGLRKGAIVDVHETIGSITAALEDAERMSGVPIHHAVIAVGGSHLAAQESRGVVAIPNGSEITPTDLERVLEAAQAVNLLANRQILKVIPKDYLIDEQKGIRNPIGMTGVRLEVNAHIITGLTPALKNLENAIHQSGVDVDDFVPAPLAAAEAVLAKRQKELGVVVIDLGASSTGLAIFEEGVIAGTAVLPLGGGAVTNDIAIGLRTSVDTAEKLKIEYGSVNPAESGARDTIDLAKISRTESRMIERGQLAEIIQARYSEIFTLVNEKLAEIGLEGQLPAGAILTGGAAKIPELLGLARENLCLPVQIGFPTEIEGVINKIDDPTYATVVGLILHGLREQRRGSGLPTLNFEKTFSGVKNFFKKLLP